MEDICQSSSHNFHGTTFAQRLRASNFYNKISHHYQFNLYHKLAKNTTKIPTPPGSQHHMVLHFSERFHKTLLHNNCVNQLARAQSPTLPPHVSLTEIYVPNIGDWAVPKNCKSSSTKCVTQSIAELCANRSNDSMSVKVIKVLNVQSTLVPLLQFDKSFFQPARQPVSAVGTLMPQH